MKSDKSKPVIALAGNPNVGKSTVFNSLTGLRQHTGNWSGKTVENAYGSAEFGGTEYTVADLPGTYSLTPHSAEEEAARDMLCFASPSAVAVVCDAERLERSLAIALQAAEICPRVVVCVNLMDEARRKGISLDLELISQRIGLPVVGVTARRRRGLEPLKAKLANLANIEFSPAEISYPEPIERAVAVIEPVVAAKQSKFCSRWLALRLLDCDSALREGLERSLGSEFFGDPELRLALARAKALPGLRDCGSEEIGDLIAEGTVATAHAICCGAIKRRASRSALDRRLDRILTGKFTAYPAMLLLLALVLWLTVSAANYPSAVLSELLFGLQDRLTEIFHRLNAPEWLHGCLVLGAYRVLAWVVSVMLPPMAIFFPLFTLLEDLGVLPRIAYNLDRPFAACNACGKQALTMCMGFGCNAVGVTGGRIIDSPRERILAVLTNNFVPCNGRFPTLIALAGAFFVGSGAGSTLLGSLIVTAAIVLGVLMTFAATKLLSATLLRGAPSAFTLELPPYRKPQAGKVIARSVLDRTVFVLGRAAAVAAPAGLIIWIAANITVGGASLLAHFAEFLDPLGRLMGLDGVILTAFILGFPANEIVLPIMIMAYCALGTLPEVDGAAALHALLTENGWTLVTAVCVMLFSLMHWPCSTTLLTVKKETGSLKYTVIAAALPTAAGILLCMAVNAAASLLS